MQLQSGEAVGPALIAWVQLLMRLCNTVAWGCTVCTAHVLLLLAFKVPQKPSLAHTPE
jgi:hypothetical protein